MDTLDRYLIREFLAYFGIILLALVAIFLGVDFLTNYWSLQTTMPMSRILTIYGYKTPGALQLFFPMACLMGTLLVLASLSRQNELLALYASGISPLRLVSTMVGTIATVSTIAFLVFDTFVPMFNKRQFLIAQGLDPAKEEQLEETQAGFWYRSDRLVYRVERFLPETNTLENVNVYVVTPSFYLLEKIHAKEAKFVDNEWVLQDGFSIEYPRETHFPISKTFTRRTGVIPEKPGDFKTLKLREDTMRLRDLGKYIKRNAGSGLDTTAQRVHYQERVALVFTPLVLILLGFPFALRPLKTQSMPRSIAFCFLVVFLYLLMLRMTLSIGKGGHIPPIMAAWTPNVLFLAFAGLYMMKRR